MSQTAKPVKPEQIEIPAGSGWRKLPAAAAAVGIAGLATSAALGWGTKEFFFSYLVSYIYWLSIALGALFFVVVQFAARAGWSVVVRRLAEHLMVPMPLFTLLFVPLALGTHELYHWTHAEAVAADPLLQHKAPYLNLSSFYIRAAIYFAVWLLLCWVYYRRSLAQDQTGDQRLTRRSQLLSGPAIVLFAFTVTFAAFDWLMSLDPHWYSTMFGPYFFAGSVVGTFGMLSFLGVLLKRGGVLREVITGEHYHDLGKLLFAFTVFWAYIAFSQFMLIWYANIPEETAWYAHRGGGWLMTSTLLGLGHFVIPFFFLLPRGIKRAPLSLLLAALWIMAMHYVDIYWIVMPTHYPDGPQMTLHDPLTFVGVGGLFLAIFARQLCRHPLIPTRDPRLAESLTFQNI